MVGIKHASLMLVVFLTSELVLMSSKVALADPFLRPSDDPFKAPSPEPRPGFFKFMHQCFSHADPECGKEIFDTIFHDKAISNECCREAVSLGINCYDNFVLYIAKSPFYDGEFSKYWEKSRKLYKTCAFAVSPRV